MSEDKVSYIVDAKSGKTSDEIRQGDRLRITRKESIEYLSLYIGADKYTGKKCIFTCTDY